MEKTQPLSLAFKKEKTELDENRNSNDNTYREIINANDDAEKNLKKVIYDPTPLWKVLLQIKRERKSICAAALGFHYAVVDMVTDMAEHIAVNQVHYGSIKLHSDELCKRFCIHPCVMVCFILLEHSLDTSL